MVSSDPSACEGELTETRDPAIEVFTNKSAAQDLNAAHAREERIQRRRLHQTKPKPCHASISDKSDDEERYLSLRESFEKRDQLMGLEFVNVQLQSSDKHSGSKSESDVKTPMNPVPSIRNDAIAAVDNPSSPCKTAIVTNMNDANDSPSCPEEDATSTGSTCNKIPDHPRKGKKTWKNKFQWFRRSKSSKKEAHCPSSKVTDTLSTNSDRSPKLDASNNACSATGTPPLEVESHKTQTSPSSTECESRDSCESARSDTTLGHPLAPEVTKRNDSGAPVEGKQQGSCKGAKQRTKHHEIDKNESIPEKEEPEENSLSMPLHCHTDSVSCRELEASFSQKVHREVGKACKKGADESVPSSANVNDREYNAFFDVESSLQLISDGSEKARIGNSPSRTVHQGEISYKKPIDSLNELAEVPETKKISQKRADHPLWERMRCGMEFIASGLPNPCATENHEFEEEGRHLDRIPALLSRVPNKESEKVSVFHEPGSVITSFDEDAHSYASESLADASMLTTDITNANCHFPRDTFSCADRAPSYMSRDTYADSDASFDSQETDAESAGSFLSQATSIATKGSTVSHNTGRDN